MYLILGLNYIVESKFMKEVHKKPKASLVGPLFSYLFDFQGFLSWLVALAPLILILLSSPKDFLITVRGDIGQVVCPVCEENTVSVGEDMLRHLGTLAVKSYEVASYLINLHQKAIAGSTKFFTHWAIEKNSFYCFVGVILGCCFGHSCGCHFWRSMPLSIIIRVNFAYYLVFTMV